MGASTASSSPHPRAGTARAPVLHLQPLSRETSRSTLRPLLREGCRWVLILVSCSCVRHTEVPVQPETPCQVGQEVKSSQVGHVPGELSSGARDPHVRAPFPRM